MVSDFGALLRRARELMDEPEPAGTNAAEWIGYLNRKIEAARLALLGLVTDPAGLAAMHDLIGKAEIGITLLREFD